MASNRDGTWELVDGVQRLSTLVMFAGDEELREQLGIEAPLRLIDMERLTSFNGFTFEELPKTIQLQFTMRSVKVITLSDKSDMIVRFDLFQRLNTGGVILTAQEIRNCVFRGRFADFLEEMGNNDDFRNVVRLTDKQETDGTKEECVLRFFAFYYGYKSFVHSVIDFLNDHMEMFHKKFDYRRNTKIFNDTFSYLSSVLPNGIKRPDRKGVTSLIFYEAVAVGTALAMKTQPRLPVSPDLGWLASPELRTLTTGATNSPKAVTGRIEFCRDRLLGQ